MKTSTLQTQTNNGQLSVAGTVNLGGPTSNHLSLSMPQAVGTYAFGPTSEASAVYSSSTGGIPTVYNAGGNSGAGTIVVTALTATNVTGTFTFTGINRNTSEAKNISNGQFNIGL